MVNLHDQNTFFPSPFISQTSPDRNQWRCRSENTHMHNLWDTQMVLGKHWQSFIILQALGQVGWRKKCWFKKDATNPELCRVQLGSASLIFFPSLCVVSYWSFHNVMLWDSRDSSDKTCNTKNVRSHVCYINRNKICRFVILLYLLLLCTHKCQIIDTTS